jgi:hypothetical protein
MNEGALRRGDIVEVKDAAEILRTLDAGGALDSMPFMPEMIPYLGRRFTVAARSEKICDTVNTTLRSRHLPNTVLLDDLRCDGSAHGGCQAECRIYWNEAWLRRVDSLNAPPRPQDPAAVQELLDRTTPATVQTTAVGEEIRYRCQATEAAKASEELSNFDPRPYLRELRTANVPLKRFARVMARALVWQPKHRLDRLYRPKGTSSKSPKGEKLDLQPGEWVRVKPLEEIEATLTEEGANRGLHFDVEMIPFCGQVMQVRGRVTQIIDEPNGRMLHFKSDCIKLENAVCSGDYSTGRWLCPREIIPYWREAWLERVDAPSGRPSIAVTAE